MADLQGHRPTRARPRILILHASTGGGHKAAAIALAKALVLTGCDVEVLDALDHMTPNFSALYKGAFEGIMNNVPQAWGAVFGITKDLDLIPGAKELSGLANGLSGQDLVRRLQGRDAIVCTHFLPLDVALHEKRSGRITTPVYAVVTDYVAHGAWRRPEADLTFCAHGRAEKDLAAGGVTRVVPSGIPIDLEYAKPYDDGEAKMHCGLMLDRPVVTLLAGGAGVGPLASVLTETAKALRGTAEIAVVCGKNEQLKAEIAAMTPRLQGPIRVFGFVNPIVNLLRASDVIVTKPGGLTTSECLALGKAIVFYEAIPGQETENAKHVAAHAAAVDGGDPRHAAQAVADLVRNHERRHALGYRARSIAKPNAAIVIARTIVSKLPRR
jgi:processive 1,2-diacylglycerol beta-glucosyltransferase